VDRRGRRRAARLHHGSRAAGRHGYCQENAPGTAEDAAQVLSISASRSVPFGSYSGNVLQTKDYSLIEPKNENKFYAPGVGMIEAVSTTGPSEDIQLTKIEHAV
jgi:hypothetical protein